MDAAYIDIPGRGLGTMHLNSDLNSRDAPILRSGRVGSAFSNKFLLLHISSSNSCGKRNEERGIGLPKEAEEL